MMHTCAVTARDELDLAEVLAQVVQPVIGALLRPGEVDSISLGWQTQRRPEPPEFAAEPGGVFAMRLTTEASIRWVAVELLLLSLVAEGESFSFDLANPNDDLAEIDLAFLRDELWSNLQDFIAESRFGWGELRG
jgi:hypothetical protein